MSRYDMHLITQTPYECRPRIIGSNTEPQDGELITEYYYNCDECDDEGCEFKSYPYLN